MRSDDKILVPVSDEDLRMLAWFGAWTPEVHRALWKVRRDWPPGFREIADTSVRRHYVDADKVEARMAAPPIPGGRSLVPKLLAYRLVEGTLVCARLTPRGRAALKLAGQDCPDAFQSHAPDVFDDVPLVTSTLELTDEREAHWRELLVEYREDDYQGRFTLTKSTASLHVTSSTGTSLNGSLRMHQRFVTLRFRNADHYEVLEASLSFEGLAELLTSSGETPVTLGNYFGQDGMRRSEPAPPPVSAKRRMLERFDATEERQEDLLRSVIAKVQAGNIPKKLQADIVRDLEVALGNGTSNRAFVVTQAVEEVSMVVESALAITAERLDLAGVVGLPASGSVLALAGLAGEEEVSPEPPQPPQSAPRLDLSSDGEEVRLAVDAAVRSYEPVDADGREIISRRVFFDRGRWMARYGLDDNGEPELLYQVILAEPGTGIGDYDLDLRRVHHH